MSVTRDLGGEAEDIAAEMNDATFGLWVDIGRRLLKGQKHYGGFKFGDYDLDQMALEEIEDFIVYRAAKKYLEKG
jgi:hypothetical protein